MPKCDPESNLLTNRLTTQSFESPAKNEWALQRGGRSAHPFSWLLSSPQQPLETEDPPTVSLAPQYTSQHLCRAIEFFAPLEVPQNLQFSPWKEPLGRDGEQVFHGRDCKNYSKE